MRRLIVFTVASKLDHAIFVCVELALTMTYLIFKFPKNFI